MSLRPARAQGRIAKHSKSNRHRGNKFGRRLRQGHLFVTVRKTRAHHLFVGEFVLNEVLLLVPVAQPRDVLLTFLRGRIVMKVCAFFRRPLGVRVHLYYFDLWLSEVWTAHARRS